jgi:tyrosyl-tRNA synthetase
VRKAPEKRTAQRALAREVTRIIHGQDAVDRAEHASGLLFGERISELDVDDIVAVFDDVPSTGIARSSFAEPGMAIADLLVATRIASSKGEAMRLVKGGGMYVNNRRVGDERARFTVDQAIAGRMFVLRKGARQYHLVRLEDLPPSPGGQPS